MPESSGLPQGDEPIRILASGLEIIRRRKHEYKDLSAFPPDDQARLTNKQNGSKFLASWNAERIADFIEEQVTALGWNRQTGRVTAIVKVDAVVGTADGKPVGAIKITSNGRYLHAYPVKE